MNGREATETIEHLLSQHQLGRLNTIQFGIVEKAWEGKSYFEIAQDLGYDPDYIKQVGSGLWRQLSGAVGEKVSKGNLCSILQRYQRSSDRAHHQGNWGEAIDISSFYGRDEELATLTDWVLDPHCRLYAIDLTAVLQSLPDAKNPMGLRFARARTIYPCDRFYWGDW